MVALEVGSYINIDNVAILQDPLVWDAMTYDLHPEMGTAQLLRWALHLKKQFCHRFCNQASHMPPAKAVQRDCAAQPCPSSGDLCSGTELTCQSVCVPSTAVHEEVNRAAPVSPHLQMCTPTWES